jgi:hypothetical protein
MEGFGGPAQPSPTIGQFLNGGYGWLEVMCKRCETRASIPLDAVRRPRDTPDPETGNRVPLPIVRDAALSCAGSYDQAHYGAEHRTLRLGASGQ